MWIRWPSICDGKITAVKENMVNNAGDKYIGNIFWMFVSGCSFYCWYMSKNFFRFYNGTLYSHPRAAAGGLRRQDLRVFEFTRLKLSNEMWDVHVNTKYWISMNHSYYYNSHGRRYGFFIGFGSKRILGDEDKKLEKMSHAHIKWCKKIRPFSRWQKSW